MGISGSSPTGGTWITVFISAMSAWSEASNFKYIAVNDCLDPRIDHGTGLFGDGATGVDLGADVCGTELQENTLPPGTYWLGVKSFAPNETGDYNIAISLLIQRHAHHGNTLRYLSNRNLRDGFHLYRVYGIGDVVSGRTDVGPLTVGRKSYPLGMLSYKDTPYLL